MRYLLHAAQNANPKAASVLDIGAGLGVLVAEARRLGFDAVGIEPCHAFVESATRVNGVEILHGLFPHPALASRKFDLIFLVDVIEHVADPLKLLRCSAESLSSDGLLVIVTPDVGSIAAKLLGQRWWHMRLAHVGYFDQNSLQVAIEKSGLTIVSQARAKWFFSIRYIFERLATYLPVEWLNRCEPRIRLLGWLYDQVIPLNLHDSFLAFARRAG